MLYAWSEKSIRIWRRTFVIKSIGVSVFGLINVLRIVGTKAVRSILTAMITEIVGSFVNIHGIIPSNAMVKKTVSILRIFLKPYRREKKKIIMVNISDAAVGSAPIPAPFATCPKKMIHDTRDQTSHVYGCGCTRFLMMSRKYGTLPATASNEATMATVVFISSILAFFIPTKSVGLKD